MLTLSKLLEKIIHKRIYNFLETNGLIYNSQYGFRSKHSCENAVSELLSVILKGKEINKSTVAVFLDLSKAFDTLSHGILLTILDRYRIRGIANDWFKSYLSNRSLRCKCKTIGGDEYSKNYPVEYGAPQGSVLGPLFFLIFTNDLYRHLENCGCILFADDTTIYMSHENLAYINHCIENDLTIVSDWFKANLLTLNPNKTVAMRFLHKKPKGKLVTIKLANTKIRFVKETKFLGIWLDENLNWNAHTSKLIARLKRNTHLLSNHCNFLDTFTLKLIYHAQIQSHLNYGLILWGNMATCDALNKIRTIQNKCMKMLQAGCQPQQMYKNLKLLNLSELINLENNKLAYKIYHKHLPSRMLDIINSDSHDKTLNKNHRYNTRIKKVPNLPKENSVVYHQSFLYRGLKSMSTLHPDILNSSNIKTMIRACKKLYHENS